MLTLHPTISVEQGELICDINERGSMDSLKYCVANKELAAFQTQTAGFAYITKRCLISLDTGLGKTLVATALMNIVNATAQRKFKWLVVVQNSNLISTYNKIKEGLFAMSICYTDANTIQAFKMFMNASVKDNDIFVITYEAVCNSVVNDFLYKYRDDFKGLIVDESHMLGNLNATSSKMIRYIAGYMDYIYFLTATPVRVKPDQILNQMFMLDPKMFEGVDLKQYTRQFATIDTEGKVVGYHDLDSLREDIMWRFVGATREDLGMKGDHTIRLILRDPLPEYLDLKKMETFAKIKGDYGGPSMQALLELVTDKKARKEKGVAYVNTNRTKDLVYNYLTEAGIRVGILDGQHTDTGEKKEVVHQKFIQGEYDILLTNITTGRDMQCNYMLFYEMTFDFQQFLGRGERGLVGNDMDIIFILIKDTEEISYFHDNMLERAMMLELIGGKDVEDIKEAYRQLCSRNQGGATRVPEAGAVRVPAGSIAMGRSLEG